MCGRGVGEGTGHYVLVVTVAAADVGVSAVNQAGGHWHDADQDDLSFS